MAGKRVVVEFDARDAALLAEQVERANRQVHGRRLDAAAYLRLLVRAGERPNRGQGVGPAVGGTKPAP